MCFEQFCVSSSLQFFCSLYLSRSLVKSNKWHRLRCNGNDCMWYLFILFILSHHTLLIDRMYWTRTFNQFSNSLTECTQYSSFIFRISNNYSIIITIYLKDTHRGNGEHDCKGQAYERGAFVRTISDLIALQTMTDYLCCIESKLQHKHGQQIALSVRMLFWRFFSREYLLLFDLHTVNCVIIVDVVVTVVAVSLSISLSLGPSSLLA